MTGMTIPTDKTVDLLQAVLTHLALVVGGITEEQLHQPTPCTEFDVEQLRDHVLGWLTNFAAGFAHPHGQAPSADIAGYRAPTDPAAQVEASADRLDRAIRAGGAARPLRLGESEMPGDMALGMILWEYQVHGWDLARATGQQWSPPVEAAEESLAFANPVMVPEDAPPLDRLTGLSGRDPSWSAPDHRPPILP